MKNRLQTNEVLDAMIQNDSVKRPRQKWQLCCIRLDKKICCDRGSVEVNPNRQKGVPAGREASFLASQVQNFRIAIQVLKNFVQTGSFSEQLSAW